MEQDFHSFKWEEHSRFIMTRLANLYRRDLLIDCTLYVEENIIYAHKNLLAAGSPYFKTLFTENPHKKSFDFDNFRHKDVKAVIDFIYFGCVKLPREDMKSFLEAAEKFQIQISREATWVPHKKKTQGQAGSVEQTNSLDDDWNSLIGMSSIKQEPSENDSLPEVSPCAIPNGRMGEKTGGDELRGCAETFISSPYQQHATNICICSQLPPGNLAFSSVQEDRQNGRINENLRTLKSPTHKKSPSDRHNGPFHPFRNVVSNSPRNRQHAGRKTESSQGLISHTSKKSPLNHHSIPHSYSRNVVSRDSKRTEESQSLRSLMSMSLSLNYATGSLSPDRNMTTNSEREIQKICDKRDNSKPIKSPVRKKSPLVRQSRSRSPTRNLVSSSSRDIQQKEAERPQSSKQCICNQSSLNHPCTSRSPTINLESNSPIDNQRISSKSENSQSLLSSVHKKSQLCRQSRSRSPTRSLNSPRPSHQIQAGNPQMLEPSISNQSPLNHPSTSWSPVVMLESITLRDKPDNRENSQPLRSLMQEESPVGQQSRSCSSTKSRVLNASRSSKQKEGEDSQLSATSTGNQAPLNQSSRSRSPTIDRGSKTMRENGQDVVKRGNSQTSRSPTPKKSLSKSRSSDRNLESNSPSNYKEGEMKSEKKQSNNANTNAKLPAQSSRISQSLPKKMAMSNPKGNQGEKSEKPRKEDKGTKKILSRRKRKRRVSSSSSDSESNTASPKTKKKKRYTCKYCGEGNLNKGSIHSHALAHRGGKDFTCMVCDKTFELWASFKKHRSTCLYQCEICNKKITRRYSLHQHLLLHSGERPYCCSQCGKHYARKCQLSTHCHSHSEKKVTKTHTCEVCGRTFNVRSSCVYHMLIHTNERPYVCDTCGKGFNDKPL